MLVVGIVSKVELEDELDNARVERTGDSSEGWGAEAAVGIVERRRVGEVENFVRFRQTCVTFVRPSRRLRRANRESRERFSLSAMWL